MRALRRRVTAMSPREKHLALLSVSGFITFAFYYVPAFLYATLIIVICCFACYYLSGEPLPARLGLNPRAELDVPGVLRRWLPGWGATGVSVAARGKTKRPEHRDTEGHSRQRPGDTGVYRREALANDSFLFSPRDFLMGSYIGKAESPAADSGRPRAGRNPREQLREKLSRPNHAVYTPNRRLSFTGELLGAASRFTITPQRHYPLQQPGVSSVGVLPPVQWDGFRKKNVLSPRNSQAALSPVTVKIARPDQSNPSVNHLRCAGLGRAPTDPCSRDSVLKVLKESRKREVEDEDRSFTTEQRSKRRRNDSGGSSHSAFEPLLPNGTPSQLVPKPGSLKRGMTSTAEESTMKRSRTSSISSGSVVHFPRGTSGTKRNAIQSSYSSSAGLGQWKKPSTPSSPLSSPESSRSQTPEGFSKRPREDDTQSPSSASSVKSDYTASEKDPDTSKQTPVPKAPVATSAASPGSGGKRKRKIQLVSSRRDDHIALPPPPELGYSITAKDLDEEKKAAISKIQKVLETPAPEPEKSASPAATPLSQPAASTSTSTSTTTLISLLTAPLPTAPSPAAPVINLDPSPGSGGGATAAAVTNPLLESLKMKASAPTNATSAASATTASVSAPPLQVGSFTLKTLTPAQPPPPYTQSQPPLAAVGQPSAFTQMLAQVSKAPGGSPAGPSLFGLPAQVSSPSAPSASTAPPASRSESAGNTNPLLAAGFKPIFPASTTAATSQAAATFDSKTSLQNFKPVFAQPPALTAAPTASTLSASTTSSAFRVTTSSTTLAPSSFSGFNNTPAVTASTGSVTAPPPAAQAAVKSPFGTWSAPPTTNSGSSAALPPNTGSTFQFGAAAAPTAPTAAAAGGAPAAATTTSSGTGSFPFGATQSDPQASGQKVFSCFGPPAPGQNTTTASFGAFGMTSTASTAAATSTTQSSFSFGKPAAQPTFGSSAAAKPFAFGAGGASSAPAPAPAPAPASNPTPAPFTFGAPAVTTAATFGTPAKPAFGASATGFAFGANSAPTATPQAAPSFGAAAQTQSSSSTSFTFKGAAPQPAPSGSAQPGSGGFNFGDGMPCPQFGTPVSSNPAPQMGTFNFGPAASDKPAFGTMTPAFGQSSAPGPVPFGSPGTPAQSFNPVSFGSPATPTFSIGAGSKPSGARQRLQARRLHNRKK
ncbi:nuclear envelope pore membrane protein POM 121 isoform X2 [Kryptolebias marmoratus]|uniref:POM121 transmembrane nucleoporin n=1 Tax=Kryptolebias marmoratus TaxID=37003 RepID=A0A3Q3GSK4_KRYMA|nr:nuclear envelope pore membrane protein POM 121 isoform X2 [Kryptolebias marmoratus]